MSKKMLFIFFVFVFCIGFVNAAEISTNSIIKEFENRGNYSEYCITTEVVAVADTITLKCNFSETGYYSVDFIYMDGVLSTSATFLHFYDKGELQTGIIKIPFEDEEDATVSPSIDFAVDSVYEMLEVVYVLNGYDKSAAELYVENADLESFTLEDDGFIFSSMPQFATIEEIAYRNLDQYSFKIDTNKVSIPKSEVDFSISVDEITSNDVVLEITYDKKDENLVCSLYRSNSLDGAFEEVINFSCFDEAVQDAEGTDYFKMILDTGLESDTKYFYKMCLVGYSNCTNVLEVTTKSLPTNDSDQAPVEDTTDEENNSQNGIENPKTGVTVGVLGLIIIALFSIISLRVFNRKSLFKRL